MLRITRLTDYATVILSHMAQDSAAVYSAKSLSQALAMGGATVSKILKLLANKGLVSSSRGKEGGYRLAKQPENIPVTEILEALEGPLAMTECSMGAGHCEQSAGCGVKDNWQHINGVIIKALREVSLADMLNKHTQHSFFIRPETLVQRIKSRAEVV